MKAKKLSDLLKAGVEYNRTGGEYGECGVAEVLR